MLFAKSRTGALPAKLSRLHTSWQTPYIAVGIIWLVGTIFLLGSSYLPSVNEILQTSISAMGYQICFYLALTGFASVWCFRQSIKKDFRASLTQVWWPLLSALFLLFVLGYSILDADRMTNIIGL